MFKKKNKNYFHHFKKWIKKFFHREEQPSFNMVEVTVVIVISILFGIIVGCILTYGKGVAKGTEDKYAKELLSTYETIVDNYYGGADKEEIVNAAIDGMVNSLGDQHSYYMDDTETFDFNQRVNGKYIGIGATVSYTEENGNTVIEIFKDSPADKAGLKVGDRILEVGDTDVSSYTLSELSALLVGDEGTKVRVVVQRGDSKKTFMITRGEVVITSVNSKLLDVSGKNVGYIDIDIFAANTYSQFKKNLNALEKEDIKGLIIDVRDNTGGHLSQVNKILSLFFDKKTVLYQIETKDNLENVYAEGKDKREYDVVVLINCASASASEILASSFQNNYKNATIVGLQSYGKGTIQNAIQLTTGASLKYTTQRWLTSEGEWLNEVGVVPDESINIEDDYYEVAGNGDTQFKRALEILSK